MLIMTKQFVKPIGHVDFITDNDGVYSICMNQLEFNEKEELLQPTRVKLSVNYGYDSEYYEKLSKKDHFEAINMEVHKLNDMMTLTLNEADYQKHKEVDYHTLTERMNIAALWWPMAQVCMRNLTSTSQEFFYSSILFCFLFSISFQETRLNSNVFDIFLLS